MRFPAAWLALGIWLCAGPPALDLGEEPRPPQTHALLINGGGSPVNNYLSHLHHLQEMMQVLTNRAIPPERVHVFSSDGADPGWDLASRAGEPSGFWLIDGTDTGRALRPADLTNTVWDGVTLHPARLAELRRWFAGMSELLEPGDTLLLFVTDHGTLNPDDPENGFVSLWNESLSVLEFRALLGYLKPGVRVVNVMSQCFSGAFAAAMTPLSSRVPGGSVCGFYSTTRDRPAYGCYAEGRDRDRVGHAFRFIDAMGRHAALDDVHTAVLLTDTSPDVPVRTSDLYLERLLREEAARREQTLDERVDEELALAWRERGRWEREIRLLDRLGEVYGSFSPRTLAELKPRLDSLQALSGELDTYEDRWKLALDDLRKDNLARFLDAHPTWKARLDASRLSALDRPTKASTLAELLPALERFTSGRAEVRTRLEELLATDEDARSAKYRTDVRLAAVLRMRTLLMRVAGLRLSSTPQLGEMRHALEALEACEAAPIGRLAAGREIAPIEEAPEPLPPFEDDLAAVRRALPSWLGIRFHPVPDKQQASLAVERGAAVVDQVYPDAPASAAGLAPGDVVLGPPGAHFREPSQIREWTMTAPRDTPLALDVQRDGKPLEVTVALASYPTRLPALPPPPAAGDDAPQLGSLRMLRAGPQGEEVTRVRHLLFFWATWCGPCKRSLPELMAWSRSTGVPVLALSDEDEATLRPFLDSWTGPFPEFVASDALRRNHQSYGVSGTPTFVLVDERGKIEWRQVGYSTAKRLGIPGWFWSGPSE